MTKHEIKKVSYSNLTQDLLEEIKALPTFNSFPYLSTRVFPALYHVNLYPSGLAELKLIELAQQQVHANKFPACLVFGPNRGLWFDAVGGELWLPSIPTGGAIIDGKLKPSQDFSLDEDYPERSCLLQEFSFNSRKRGGFLVGNPKNCLRDATPEDTKLGSICDKGIPNGVTVCDKCGDLKGECFYPASKCYPDKVWKLTCRCDNDNLCAACGKPLHDHKIDACYYDKNESKVFHIAGYSALSHVCGRA